MPLTKSHMHMVPSTQVRGYFSKLAERLEKCVAGGKAKVDGAGEKAAGETIAVKGPAVTGKAQGASRCEGAQAAKDYATEGLTACVTNEVEALQRILYMFPKTPGGVPDEFMERSENVATLKNDGVEEVFHQSADASRSGRGGDRVVVTVDD